MVKIITAWPASVRVVAVATGGKLALKSQAIEQKSGPVRSTS
jgi:hypothetical protein